MVWERGQLWEKVIKSPPDLHIALSSRNDADYAFFLQLRVCKIFSVLWGSFDNTIHSYSPVVCCRYLQLPTPLFGMTLLRSSI
jgi:hypothetical protein